MGKRKNPKDIDYIVKKLRKLEKKVKHSRKRRHSASSSSSAEEVLLSDKEDNSPVGMHTNTTQAETETNNTEDVANSNSAMPVPVPVTEDQEEVQAIEPDIDESYISELLGDDPSATKSYGKEINTDLAVRLQYFVTTGLSKELRRDLQSKYLPPSNCTLIDAPALNPEIKAAVTDIVIKRDRGIELKQKELGCAIACISEAVSILLNEQEKNTPIIKLLMDASRLICDCLNTDSITRRNYILYNLKKDLKEQIKQTKIDNFLFGANLAEALKTAKSISKSGADLKSTPVNKNIKQANQQQSNPRSNLNWKPPPSSRRQKGNPRRKEPAQNRQHTSSSKTTHQGPSHQNRRHR